MTAATNRRNRRATTRSRRRAGRKTTQIGASATTTWGYDSSDRLQYLRSGSLTRFTYSYDNNSNLKTVEDLIGSRSTYLYDAKNRLTQDASSGTNAHTYGYSYDSRDNRTYSGEEGQWQFAYDAANRLVTAVNAGEDPEPVRTFTYDDNGNTTRIEDSIAGTTTMAYDCENRLSVLQTASSLATYLYDGDGRKRVEIGASGRTTLVWDGWDYLQSYAGSKPLDYHTVDGLILAQRMDEDYAEYLPDFLGTVAAYADESGSPLAEARYKPYGLPLWSDGPVEDFAFGWVGQWGYRRAVDGIYVRGGATVCPGSKTIRLVATPLPGRPCPIRGTEPARTMPTQVRPSAHAPRSLSGLRRGSSVAEAWQRARAEPSGQRGCPNGTTPACGHTSKGGEFRRVP